MNNKSWKENNKLKEAINNDYMTEEEVNKFVGLGCPLVARDYSGEVVGTVVKITDNFEEVKAADELGGWDDTSAEEFKEQAGKAIIIKTPIGFMGYAGMNKPTTIGYVFTSDGGAYVLKSDNKPMMTLYDEEMFDHQF